MRIEKIDISLVKSNEKNPRKIKGEKLKKLIKSIKDFPEMLEVRPIVIDDDGVVLRGNMRLQACKSAGLKEIPVVRFSDISEEKKKEFIVKDNLGYGEWDYDLLKMSWDDDLLLDWGMDPFDQKIDDAEEGEVIKVEKSLQVLPKYEYIIVVAREDSDEWEELKGLFKCQLVRQGGCKVGSTSDKVTTGLERVFSVDEMKKRLGL